VFLFYFLLERVFISRETREEDDWIYIIFFIKLWRVDNDNIY